MLKKCRKEKNRKGKKDGIEKKKFGEKSKRGEQSQVSLGESGGLLCVPVG